MPLFCVWLLIEQQMGEGHALRDEKALAFPDTANASEFFLWFCPFFFFFFASMN
jgi:hypothetical protein